MRVVWAIVGVAIGGLVAVTAAEASIAALTWKGNASGAWDVNNTPNFSGTTSKKFSQGDLVTFDDTGMRTMTAVAASGVAPGAVVFSNTPAKAYTLFGGPIYGATSLIVSGGGEVTLAGTHRYTGGTIVNSGMLVMGVNSLPAGHSVTIGTNGTLVLSSELLLPEVPLGNGEPPIAVVPEPSTVLVWSLLGVLAIGAGWSGKRRAR